MNTGGMMLDHWTEQVGISRSTAKRWRKIQFNGSPMLSLTSNIFGYHFITAEEDAKFWSRAKAGEFAKEISAVCAAGEIEATSPLVHSNDVAVSPSRRRGRGRAR